MAGRGTDIMLGGNAEYLAKNDLKKKYALKKEEEQLGALQAVLTKMENALLLRFITRNK